MIILTTLFIFECHNISFFEKVKTSKILILLKHALQKNFEPKNTTHSIQRCNKFITKYSSSNVFFILCYFIK